MGRLDIRTANKPDVDLTVEDQWDRGISRRHARVYGRRNRYAISDLGSSNGTWINGEKLPLDKTMPLRLGDEIRLGGSILYFDEVPDLYKMFSPPAQYFFYATFTGHFFPLLAKSSIVIGRGDPSLLFKPDVDLSEEGEAEAVVSRHHARLFRNGNRFEIEDLGSAGKTQIDGQPVDVGTRVPIAPGQHLWLGGCVLAFDMIQAPVASS